MKYKAETKIHLVLKMEKYGAPLLLGFLVDKSFFFSTSILTFQASCKLCPRSLLGKSKSEDSKKYQAFLRFSTVHGEAWMKHP